MRRSQTISRPFVRAGKVSLRVQPSKTELLLEPLIRARDLLRALSNSMADTSAGNHKIIDAALRACDDLVRSLPHVESDPGRRAFTRELYRTWAVVLEVREILGDVARVRVFREIEEAMECVRSRLSSFESHALEDSPGYRA
jgi:hypothetical protein